jgi:tRNA nucleotidyltransferase (CCA-adding enzyme)
VLSELARTAHERGGRALAVGGCVRDHLLGEPSHDWDVEVFGLAAETLEKVLRKLGRVDLVGRAFGVFKLTTRDGACHDVSLPRRDSKVGPGHRGIQVEGDPSLDLREAARRRDLTVNAIFADLRTGELVDPWGGIADLRARRLAAVDPTTFLEDPLRALRVVQFTARLGFDVDPTLADLCRQAPLDELPAERVSGEWEKLSIRAPWPARGMRVAREMDILRRVFPEAVDDPARDSALDALVPTRTATAPLGRQWALMLSGWLAGQSPAAIEATLDRLWMHKVGGYAVRESVRAVCTHWGDAIGSDGDIRRLSAACEAGIALAVRQAVTGDAADALARAAALGVLTDGPARLLLGRHLREIGIAPGPAMGRVLAAVYAAQLEGQVTTAEDALALARTLASEAG